MTATVRSVSLPVAVMPAPTKAAGFRGMPLETQRSVRDPLLY